jgi:hypothetical protein
MEHKMPQRTLKELEAFLVENGVNLEDRAFELELSSYGWRVKRKRSDKTGVHIEIECLVECDDNIPRSLKVVSDDGYHDRDVALMRALERVLDLGFLRAETSD